MVKFSKAAVTAGVSEWMKAEPGRTEFIMYCMGAMMLGHWGDVCDEDAATNNDALESGARLMGVYPILDKWVAGSGGEDTIWIIIDAVQDDQGNRGPMTALFPQEY